MRLYKSLAVIFVLAFLGQPLAFAKPIDPITFSFASDDFENGPTFTGLPGNAIVGKAKLKLYIDLNHDLLGGKVVLKSIFRFKGETYKYQVFPYGGQWLHTWRVRGGYEFLQAGSGLPIMTSRFHQAVLTSVSPSKYHAGETLTLQDSERVDPNILMVPHKPLLALGVGPNDLNYSEDFAFTFTSTKPVWSLIPLTSTGGFVDKWTSEGSYSAAAIRVLP